MRPAIKFSIRPILEFLAEARVQSRDDEERDDYPDENQVSHGCVLPVISALRPLHRCEFHPAISCDIHSSEHHSHIISIRDNKKATQRRKKNVNPESRQTGETGTTLKSWQSLL